MPDVLTDYEVKILRHLSGEEVPGPIWGPAMNVAIDSLHYGGYVRQVRRIDNIQYVLTDKGRALIKGVRA